MRTFIAIPLPPEGHALLARLQEEMRMLHIDVRWTKPSSIHITLKFLGEIPPAMIDRLADALRAVSTGHGPFRLCQYGIGGFPDLRNPRIIWCGIEGELDRLRNLQTKVERVCADFGIPPETRKYSPHLTLGRIQSKTNLQHLQDYIKIAPDFEQEFAVERYHVYQSILTPQAPQYSILQTIELG